MNNIFRIDSRRQFSMSSSDEYLFKNLIMNIIYLLGNMIFYELYELCSELSIDEKIY